MPAIRSAAEIAEKWARVTPGRASDYAAGIEKPKKDWEQMASAAADAWADGVTAAASEGRYEKGVKAAGTEKWRRKAKELGVSRWPAGVSAAKDDYERGFAPFRDVIERVTLPPRRPKGDPANIERVRLIATALHEAKMRML